MTTNTGNVPAEPLYYCSPENINKFFKLTFPFRGSVPDHAKSRRKQAPVRDFKLSKSYSSLYTSIARHTEFFGYY